MPEHLTAALTPPRPTAARADASGGGPLTPLELAAWRGFLRAHARLTRAVDADLQARHRLSLSAYEVLMLLADAPDRRMRISDLSSATILSVSGVSRLVDRLVRAGLVAKEACPEDARGAFARLTDQGATRLEAARASHLAAVRALFLARFGEAELRALAEGWERLREG
jgi:DNA-binding MarR family transcriptional regulator